MVERFTEKGPIGGVQTSTGAAQGFLSLADRLKQFQVLGGALTQTGIQGVKRAQTARGTATGQQVELIKEDGTTRVPEFKEVKFFGGIEAQAHNKALRSAYLNSLKNDARGGIARIESENPTDLIGFNEAIKGFTNGMLKGADPKVKQELSGILGDRATSSRIKVQNAVVKSQNEIAGAELDDAAQTFLNESLRFARNGDVASSATGLLDYAGALQDQVDAKFITEVGAREKMREAEKNAAAENLTGVVARLASGGKSIEALGILGKTRENIPKGFSTQEHEDLTDAMSAEINESINTRNKIESEEDRGVDDKQKINYANLSIGISSGTSSMQDVVRNLRNGGISESHSDKLINLLNRRGQGINRFDLINTIRGEMNTGMDPAEIKNTIIANSGTNLTEATASSLLSEVDEMQNTESVLNKSTVRRARDFIVPSIRVTGPLGALDTEAEQRLAGSIRDFDTRVLNGEDPWQVADELVGKDRLEREPQPLFGTKEDLDSAMVNTDAKFDAGEIDDSTYNFEVERITRLRGLIQNIQAFDKSRKEADANTIE